MLRDLLAFVPLAVLTNTVFPMPFDPVLISFASGHSRAEACALAVLGSACAGAAAVVDALLLGRAREALASAPAPCGRRFYVIVFAVALLPLPFSLVRAALFRVRPDVAKYALAVALGRLPRYLAIVLLWQSVAVSAPPWVGPAVLAAGAALAVVQVLRARRSPSPAS